ncbi:sensor histidine kinase [Oerskovia enterophila]|uniref:histidine kinase n=1 Tax=Oerskovia enterophila TaxID=43678 RepID=A0ABX2Y9Q6_9CELL|nr:histidine kinase [Oerskovia enterophila]OCI33230.1 sensor histidine kinase DesK [Oerskovia enterophila]
MLDTLHRRLAAVGIRTSTGRDALLGVVVAVLTVGFLLAVERVALTDLGIVVEGGPDSLRFSTGGRVAAIVLVVAQAMALTLRRRAPLLALALTVVGQVALVPVLPAFVSFQAPATLVAAYSVGAYAPRRTALWAAAAAAGVQVLLSFVLGGPVPITSTGPAPVAVQVWGGLASALLTYVASALVGAYVGTRRELFAQLQGRVAQAERERDMLAAQAVLEERGRMARELHDVAAHHLSGIVVQAAAAERLVDRDPERAKESMRWIRTQGRETLDNLRLVVGILRSSSQAGPGEPGEEAPAAPQPTLDDAGELLDLARSAGAEVRDVRRGSPFGLSPAVQLTVYRVLQEALSNARRHAPGRAIEVVTDYQQAALVLTVTNRLPVAAISGGRTGRSAGRDLDARDGHGAPAAAAVSDRSTSATAVAQAAPGHGLIGMTERATLVGGKLSAGSVPGDGWRVRLSVPRPAAAEAAAPTPTIPERSATSSDEPGSAVGQEAP